MAGDNESAISKLWKKYNETNFSDQKWMQSGYNNSVLPDNSKDSFNYNPRAPQENNSDSIKKLREFVNPTIAPLVEKFTKNLPYDNYNPTGEGGTPSVVLPKIKQQQLQENTSSASNNLSTQQQNNTPKENTSTTPDTQETTPSTKEEPNSIGGVLGGIVAGIAGTVVGAFVGGGTEINNPFSGSNSNVGSLSSSNSSVSAALNSTPSGGDSGTVGESQFGGDDVQGKSAIDILSKIYKVLSQTNSTVNKIARDTAASARNRTQQDISSDLASTNARARQNEMGGAGNYSPVYGIRNNQEEDDSSILDSILSFFTGDKKKKGGEKGGAGDVASKIKKEVSEDAVEETAKKAAKETTKKSGLKDAFTSRPTKKLAGTAAVGGAAVAMANANNSSEKDTPSIFGGNTAQQNDKPINVSNSQSNTPNSMEDFKSALLENDQKQKAADEEYQKIKSESSDSPDYIQRLSDADRKVQSLGNSKIGIINDEKYKDSKDFLDKKSRNDVYEFYKDPDYFKKNGISENKPSYEEHLTTNVSNFKSSSKNGEQPVSESSNSTTTSNFKSTPNPIKVSGSRPYILQDDGEGGKMKYDLETTELTPASPDDIKDAELQQQQDAIANNKNLTVDEANAQSHEIWRQQQDIEYNRINKENPTPGIDTVENVSTTKEFKEKYGDESGKLDPLNYSIIEKQRPGGKTTKMKVDLETRKMSLASEDDITEYDKSRNQYNERKPSSQPSSAQPVTPFNYESQITESKNLGLSDLEKEKQSKLEAIGARRGKEGEDDAALDAEGEKVLDEFNSKKQAATSATPTATQAVTPIPNSNSDGLNDRERGEANAYKDQVANSGMYKKVTPSTFGKATEAGNAMVDEVGGIDKREKELKAELEQQSMHTAYSDKESMDKDLNRLNEIYAERDKLTGRRNDITATDEYRNAAHARKTGNSQQQQAPQQPQAQKPPPGPPPAMPPASPAGTGMRVPSVRNNDPTIRMMEQGSMWSTQGGLMT